MRRRDFLSCAALAAACTAVPSLAFSQEKKFKTVLKKADIADPSNFAYMEELKKMGYDGVETWVYSDKSTIEAAEKQRKFAESIDFRIHSTIYGWSNLQTTDEDDFKKQVADVAKCLEIAAAYGADTLLWVPARVSGVMPKPWEFKYEFDEKTNVVTKVAEGDNAPYADYIKLQNHAMEQTRRALETLIPVAEKNNVIIGFENVWNNLWCMPDVFANFVKTVDNKWFRSYYDMGNHVRYAPTEEWVKALGSTIVKLHIKGFKLNPNGHDGKWCSFRDASINWPVVRQALEDVGYSGFVSIEQGGDRKKLCEELQLVFDGK
ncbi:MAG: sugar phosphate isomerase/epimerase [Thermoguttaceae bacterium]|nr:sugar phosphate isomerase/epimerase [Thermoguttaceae bacterium]